MVGLFAIGRPPPEASKHGRYLKTRRLVTSDGRCRATRLRCCLPVAESPTASLPLQRSDRHLPHEPGAFARRALSAGLRLAHDAETRSTDPVRALSPRAWQVTHRHRE